jgi:integrative and conjugative element protein (TIGR02256 family)
VRARIETAWLRRGLREQIEHEADLAYPLETGGVLVGYVADNGAPVVHAVIGPGLNALHFAARFEPDHAWQCERLDDLFKSSSGQWVYLGDWHTHPDGRPKMSWLDRRTLRRIAKHSEAGIARPLMLIVAGSPGAWTWAVYCNASVSWGVPRSRPEALQMREL